MKSKNKPKEKLANKKDIERCDFLVLGGGLAGLTAALYSVRYNMKTTIIAKSFGGTGNIAGLVENWPGFVGSGLELMNKIVQQVKDAGANFVLGEVIKVEKDKEGFYVELEDKIIHGKSLVVALGMQYRKLNVVGEDRLLGKGVSYCTACDGMFFKNKIVSVIGGGDSASKAALYLSEICKKVYIIYRKDELRCEPIALDQIKSRKNIEVYYMSQPIEVIGEKKVSGIKIKNTLDKTETTLDIDGVFIEIGAVPFVDVVKPLGIKTNEGT